VSVLGFGLVLLSLSACGGSPKVLEVSAKPIEMPKLNLPRADVLDLTSANPVKWHVVTLKNYKEVFAKIKKSGRPMTLFALTDKGYASLGLQLSDIRAFIEQQKSIIIAYESYYKESNKALEDANKQMQQNSEEYKKLNESEGFLKGLLK
jgi:predicted ArsR family transcriptional regulator